MISNRATAGIDSLRLARARLLIQQPWLSALIMRLEPIASPGLDTTATDGKHLYYDPDFFSTQGREEQMMLIAHEAMHAALGHCDPARRAGRHEKKWNFACDHAINLMLAEAGMTLPVGSLAEKKYCGMAAEKIYGLLPDAPGGGCGGCGGLRPGGKTSAGDIADVKIALAAAAHAIKRAGLGGPSWDEYLDDASTPPIDWRDVLRAEIASARRGQDDFSWRRPGRQGLATGLYLPSMIGLVPGPIAIAIDTSGSMSMDEIAEAVAIVRDCAEREQPEIVIMIADETIRSEARILPGEDYRPAKVAGRGGTDFRPAQRRAQELDVQTLIYISDMAGPTLERDARGGVETIWITRAADTRGERAVVLPPTSGAGEKK